MSVKEWPLTDWRHFYFFLLIRLDKHSFVNLRRHVQLLAKDFDLMTQATKCLKYINEKSQNNVRNPPSHERVVHRKWSKNATDKMCIATNNVSCDSSFVSYRLTSSRRCTILWPCRFIGSCSWQHKSHNVKDSKELVGLKTRSRVPPSWFCLFAQKSARWRSG